MYSIISYKSTFSHAPFHQQGLIVKEVIIQVIKEHDQSKPLFLYIPIQSVHNPYEVPDKYKEVILKRSRLCMLTHTLLTVFGGGGGGGGGGIGFFYCTLLTIPLSCT